MLRKDRQMKNRHCLVPVNEKGFTLIEIIAVLVILGILSAVAIPKFVDLQEDARGKAAEAAIAEVKSRLSMGYGKYLLANGAEPANIAAICGASGVNDSTILPTTLSGATSVPMGSDFTVTLTVDSAGTTGTITVTQVQGTTLTTSVSDDWVMP